MSRELYCSNISNFTLWYCDIAPTQNCATQPPPPPPPPVSHKEEATYAAVIAKIANTTPQVWEIANWIFEPPPQPDLVIYGIEIEG